jgi:hypothetical protein
VTAPALIKEADMMRAIRAAKKLGAARVSISTPNGGMIVFDIRPPVPYVRTEEPDESGPIKIRKEPKRKVF